jgi:hypothetical protein
MIEGIGFIAATICYLAIGRMIANHSMYVWIGQEQGVVSFLLFPIKWHKKSVGTIDPYRGHAHCLLLSMTEITEDSDLSDWFAYRQWKMALWPLPVMWSVAVCPTVLAWTVFVRISKVFFPEQKVKRLLDERQRKAKIDVKKLLNEKEQLKQEIEEKETRLEEVNELLKLESNEDPLEKEFALLAANEAREETTNAKQLAN